MTSDDTKLALRPDPAKMLDLIIRLHNEGTLSEGQVARATGLHRIRIRELSDAAASVSPAGRKALDTLEQGGGESRG